MELDLGFKGLFGMLVIGYLRLLNAFNLFRNGRYSETSG